jgi:hypothetical protein
MTGRNVTRLTKIWRMLFVVMMNEVQIPLMKIKIKCPDCKSVKVRPNGTKKSGNKRVESFICKNPACVKKRRKLAFKKGKQFIVTTSYEFKKLINTTLRALYEDLLKDGAKNTTIAKKYNISSSQISILRNEIEDEIERHGKLDSIVEIPQPDRAIAMDETFLRIEGKPVYIIIATGYTSRKTLGIKVSTTRKEKDMREVFEEADRNTIHPISAVTSDAWTSTIAMIKNVGRDITHVIHKHKKPYKKVVTMRYDYRNGERITTITGVKNDATKRRGKREGRYLVTRELVNPPPSQKRGRKKGSKNKKKKSASKNNQKRGRKGLFKVFDKGQKFYFKVDPYRNTIRTSSTVPFSVIVGIKEALDLFARKTIQNNLAETKNSILRAILCLRGPKTVESVERRIRAVLIVRNKPDLLKLITINRNVQGSFYLKNLKVIDLPKMQEWAMSM